MTYGSNESLYYPDEELDLNLRTGTPLQKSFEKVDVGHGKQQFLSYLQSEKATISLTASK